MALRFGNTKDLGGSIKAMSFAPAGYGKTKLCGTAPAPLIISAEEGLLSLKREALPFIAIETLTDFQQAYNFVTESAQAKHFATICIDSASDIAEAILGEMMGKYKDPRQAYGEMATGMMKELRKWKHIQNKHVYITCKQMTTSTGLNTTWMPGQQLPLQMPHWGDELFALRILKNPETGQEQRFLQTQPDINFYAKDRSGSLDFWEPPNLAFIFDKIQKAV